MDPEKIGKFIYTLRKEKNLSQYQLAELIPISRQAVSKWERGKTTPDSLTLIKLSEIFNVTINELLNGERLLYNSFEELQETTLHILDQSNKKSKRIKHNIIIFTTIIVILLLSFLSYYFINSYNSIRVYKVGTKNDNFMTTDGILVATKEKYYLKLGKLRYSEDLKINNIKLYYKYNSNYKLLLEDKNTDDLTVLGSYGYGEKIIINDIDELIKNLYIDIYYDQNKIDTVKLRFIKDFTNTELFTKEKRNGVNKLIIKNKDKEQEKEENKDAVKEESKEEKTEETKKETTQPTINENKENKNDNNKPQETPKQEPQQVEEPQPQPVQEEVTPDLIINKIKEKGNNNNGTYEYSNNNNGITLETTYNSMMNQIITVKSNGDSWTYIGFINMFTCEQESDANLCKNKVIDDYNNYIK